MDHLRAHRCSFLSDVSSIPSSERIIIPKTLKKNSSLFTTFLLVTASKKFDRWLENVKLVEGSYFPRLRVRFNIFACYLVRIKVNVITHVYLNDLLHRISYGRSIYSVKRSTW